MKTALLITGQLRKLRASEDAIKKFFVDPYGSDVYFDVWYNHENIDRSNQSFEVETDYNYILESFKPKQFCLEDFNNSALIQNFKDFAPTNLRTLDGGWSYESKPINVLFMYYKLWKANYQRRLYEKLAQFKYDLVIKIRTDLFFHDVEKITGVDNNTVYIPLGFDHRGGVCDLMAYGNSETMTQYCSMFEKIPSYNNAGHGFHPESLLKTHLTLSNLHVQRFKINYTFGCDHLNSWN